MQLLMVLAQLMAVAWCLEDNWQPIVSEARLLSAYTPTEADAEASSPQLRILNRRPIYPRPLQQSFETNKVSSLYNTAPASDSDSCSVYKVSMNQELFYQYLEYDTKLPDLKEFTLCMWAKFHNHSSDHPLFSYAVEDSPKEISAWISNTAEASYFSMAVHGQTFFRLNYPIKLNTWYHTCQSWNGRTGEWQIWVNTERVGRGFHNRLVGHVIKGGGRVISGQEQSLLYKNDPAQPIKSQPGLVGEITMLQLYHVALTAGKAHRDHKHHHAHRFTHDGSRIESSSEFVTEPPPPEPTPLGNGHFLIGGQLQKPSHINIAMPSQQQGLPAQIPKGLQIQQEISNKYLANRIVSEQQLLAQIPSNHIGNNIPAAQIPLVGLPISGQRYPNRPIGPAKGSSVSLSSSLLNPANVQYIDDTINHNLYKRSSTKRDKRDNPEKQLEEERITGKKDKRGLVALSDGSIVDEALLSTDLIDNNKEDEALFQQSLLSGLAGVVGNLPVQNLQKMTVDEREPAEAEVKAVMNVCSGCAPEPFKKVLVLSWRSTPKKLYSGAHYYKGLPICRAF
ncbi:unnamed protein product [Leptosia nina]|uniref:Pentraxin (PTX) domain-containing protein n=1 Tax=Leptosia nina TaxID=320188 RepID=A0AAV1JYY0_9NEOP